MAPVAAQAEQTGADQVVVTLPGRVITEGLFDLDPELGEDEHAAMIFATTEQRLAQSAADLAALTTPMQARTINGVRIPLYLPRVETSVEREWFTLTAIPVIAVEAVGRRFADQHESTLRRAVLDAERDISTGKVTIAVRELVDASDQVNAAQTRMEYGTIESDLVRRLLSSNYVESSVIEANAARASPSPSWTGRTSPLTRTGDPSTPAWPRPGWRPTSPISTAPGPSFNASRSP